MTALGLIAVVGLAFARETRGEPMPSLIANPSTHREEPVMSEYTGASAIVVGGSIGGLTAALLLRDLGFTVDVYERTATALDGRGSGIVLQPDTVRWFTERSTQDLADLSTSTSFGAVPRPHG